MKILRTFLSFAFVLILSLVPLSNLKVKAATDNLIANNSVETVNPSNTKKPLSWTNNSWGNNPAAFEYVSDDAHSGNKSLKVTLSQYSDGDAKWYFSPVAVNRDSLYELSDYYKSDTNTSVVAAFDMSDGSIFYSQLATLAAASGWTLYQDQFSVPLGAKDVTIYHLIQSNGWLQTDDYSLQSYTPVGFNRALATLTFDDGIDSTYINGLPLLQKYGFHSTDYIISGMVDQPGYMTESMVRDLHDQGNEIGSHTVTHPDLNTLTTDQIDQELSQSQSTLENILGGTPVNDFAAPYGNLNSNVLNEVKKYYASNRSVEPGFNSQESLDAYNLKVQDVDVNTTLAEYTNWINQAIDTNTWVIFVYHAVDPDTASAGQYDVTPTQLDAQLNALKNSGITVETMVQALNEVNAQLNPPADNTPPPLVGDLNNDGLVDIFDLSIFLSSYGTPPNTADKIYNPTADLNNDGKIDIFDLSILLANYGKENP